MKKIITLLTLISIMGFSTIGCRAKVVKETVDKKTTDVGEMDKTIVGQKDASIIKDTVDETSKTEENKGVGYSDETVKALYNFYEVMRNQDIEKVDQYALYYEVGDLYPDLKSSMSYFSDKEILDIIGVEEISEGLRLVHIKEGNSGTEIEDTYILKKVDDNWLVAFYGIVSYEQSIYASEQVKDGEIAIYLREIYHYYNGMDRYVISITNNTDQMLYVGFVNNCNVIYENDEGKKSTELNEQLEINPYNNKHIYLDVNSSEGPVSSIILTEVMLGIQAKTGNVEVLMGEMVEK